MKFALVFVFCSLWSTTLQQQSFPNEHCYMLVENLTSMYQSFMNCISRHTALDMCGSCQHAFHLTDTAYQRLLMQKACWLRFNHFQHIHTQLKSVWQCANCNLCTRQWDELFIPLRILAACIDQHVDELCRCCVVPFYDVMSRVDIVRWTSGGEICPDLWWQIQKVRHQWEDDLQCGRSLGLSGQKRHAQPPPPKEATNGDAMEGDEEYEDGNEYDAEEVEQTEYEDVMEIEVYTY